jgi:hypothetical protein
MENYFPHENKKRHRDQGKDCKPIINNARYSSEPSHALDKQNTGYAGHTQGAEDWHTQKEQQ